MRRRSSRYRRRRGPRTAVLVGVLALLAALGVAAAVTAASHRSGARASASANGAPGAHELRQRRVPERSVLARRRRLESRQIDAVRRYTPFIAAGTSKHRLMALTFDDGPSPYTPSIVRILARMHVPATFFVVGQQLRYFSAGVRDEVAHGFEVGDHTENHAWLAHLTTAEQYAQIRDAEVGVERLGAPTPRLFRPPYGIYNFATLANLRRLHMLMVMWSIDPGDWRRPGTKAIVANVLSNSKPGRIVIMHDGGGDRTQTIAALPAIIRGLRRRGYGLVSVPQLITLDPPPRHQQLPRLGTA